MRLDDAVSDAVSAVPDAVPAPSGGRFKLEPATRGRSAAHRYVGRDRRGNPGYATVAAFDLDLAVRELQRARTDLVAAYAIESPARRRRAVRDELDRIAWATRLLDELVMKLGGTPGDCG